jgi:cytochrome c-type biogenesis protein CcmH
LSAGESAEISLGYAEALILADRRTLTTSAADLLEFVLSEQPNDARALWYGGLSSAALGQNAEAISRWTRLLEQELPDNLRTVVQTQLAQLGATLPDATTAGATADAAGIVVEATLSIAPELAGQVPANAALFVFARDANQPGPPIAVKRLRAGEFPVTVRLSDADAMVAGRKIADAAKLKIVARISLQGSAIEAPGDLYGESLPDAGSNPVQVELNIDSVAE